MSDTNSLAAGVQPSCSLAEGEGASVSSPGCCTTPRPDCMGMLIPSIGDRCAALQDTSMGTVPGTTPGAGALAPAPEVLTIHREGLETQLFMERQDADAVACVRKIYKRSKYSVALCWALSSLQIKWEDRVEVIRRRGGLLHIGAGV